MPGKCSLAALHGMRPGCLLAVDHALPLLVYDNRLGFAALGPGPVFRVSATMGLGHSCLLQGNALVEPVLHCIAPEVVINSNFAIE